MQASVAPTYAMDNLDAPRPVQDVSDAQGGNRVDLQRQRQDDRRLHITGELTSSTCQYPELLSRILDKIETIEMIHQAAHVRQCCYSALEAPQTRHSHALQAALAVLLRARN